MASLNTWVHAHDPSGVSHVFGPGDDVPAWACEAITAPDVWAVPPDPAGDGSAMDPDTSGDVDDDSPPDDPETGDPGSIAGEVPESVNTPADPPEARMPPKGGPGSGRAAWAAYAQANGVDVTDEMKSRDDIVAACVVAGVATEPAPE